MTELNREKRREELKNTILYLDKLPKNLWSYEIKKRYDELMKEYIDLSMRQKT
jgi:hypothetical protein